MHSSLKRMWALLGVVAAIGAVAATSAIASHKAGPTIVIWTDANRAASVSKVANAWAASNGATIQVVTKDFGSIETALGTVSAADAPDVVVAARLDRPAGRERSRRAALPEQGRLGAVPEVHARRVLVRHRRQEALRHPGADREHRPAREHEARQGPDDLRAARERGARRQEEGAPLVRHLRPAGLRRRRVPHVPILLRPRWLRLRHQQGREPEPEGRRRREPDVHQELEADRQVEQGRPDQLEDRLLGLRQRVHEVADAVLDHRPVGRLRHPEGRRDVQGRPGARDRPRRPCRSSASTG